MRSTPALLVFAALFTVPAFADPVVVPVTLSESLGPTQSGRLLVFTHRLDANEKPDEDPNDVDLDIFSNEPSAVAAREVSALSVGRVALVDAETDTYPAPFSTLPPGTYEIQAVLDRNHDFNYDGRTGGDLVSKVLRVPLPGPMPTLTLERVVPEKTEASMAEDLPPDRRAIFKAWAPKLQPVHFRSPKMTAFRAMPTYINGWVALPPGYDGKKRFATSYSFPGFGSTLLTLKRSAATMMALMADKKAPPMIWVYLDYEVASGTHEFADSANNGPWGAALTTELIPALEREYRMIGRPAKRFLTGHSSGGWAALWLQVAYPKLFGGSWPVSPDPSDFHQHFGVDLYAPNANMYVDANGKPWVGGRPDKDGFVVTLAAMARSEAVLGPIGGQFSTYDFIYSPRGEDGRPLPMYDRVTGKVNPAVVAYWGEHYDIARIITRDWHKLRPHLDGKIHLSVGAVDSWNLDQPAMALEAAMKSVGAKTDFRYIAGKGHNDVYARDGDRNALLKDIAWQMYLQR
jgi:Putative esterase